LRWKSRKNKESNNALQLPVSITYLIIVENEKKCTHYC
jgi:hypothetical protein